MNYILPFPPEKVVQCNSVTEEHGCSIVCACWVPQMLTDAHKQARKTVATDLLHWYKTEGEGFLSQTVMGMKFGSTILNQNPNGQGGTNCRH